MVFAFVRYHRPSFTFHLHHQPVDPLAYSIRTLQKTPLIGSQTFFSAFETQHSYYLLFSKSSINMKSTFHSAILALALSVSAAPVENHTTSGKDVQQTSPLAPGNQPSGNDYGPPTFFGDKSHPYKGPTRADDIREQSPSAKLNGIIYPIPGNSTTTSTPAITTSTSQRLDKRFRAASRLVTPNVNNHVAEVRVS